MLSYEIHQGSSVQAPALKGWLALGLTLSLALHAGLFYAFYLKRVDGFQAGDEQHVSARVFKMKRVAIPEMPPAEQKFTLTEKPSKMANLTLPAEKPVLQEVRMAPSLTDLSRNLVTEKPKVEAASETLAKMEASSRRAMDRELSSITQSLLREGPRMPRQPLLTAAGGRSGAGAPEGDAESSVPGMASVDDLLGQAGSLKAGEKAAMPGGALFEYDRYDLLPAAEEALRKLALLIQQNPRATFSIEGHTDATGTPEYNERLSLLRAEAVKSSLVRNMGVAPERIQTRGYGSSRLLVPAERSKEDQAPNRRVEIVVKTNRR